MDPKTIKAIIDELLQVNAMQAAETAARHAAAEAVQTTPDHTAQRELAKTLAIEHFARRMGWHPPRG